MGSFKVGFGWFILARATGYVPVRESFRLPMGGWRPVAIYGFLLAAVFVMAPVLLWSWMTLPRVSPRSRGPLPSARG